MSTPSPGTEPCSECERLKKELAAEINHLKNATDLYVNAKAEILRLREELLIMAGILADEDEDMGDTLPAKEK